MKYISGLDVKIANYFARKLNNFLAVKEQERKRAEKERWIERFGGSESIVHNLDERTKINLYKDSVLSKLIYDGFEVEEIDFLNSLLEDGDVFIDIGSNVGLFSLNASQRVGSTGRVVSFEPSSSTYKRLIENIDLNGFRNIEAVNIGLGEEEKILELNVSMNGYEAWNTFVPSKGSYFSVKEFVQVKTLDAFCEERSINTAEITLIKLDVEGFELNVLKGATKMLMSDEAPIFLIEFTDANSIAAGHCCHDIYRFLRGYGYSWYRYDHLRKMLISDPMRIGYPYTNLVAIKDLARFSGLQKFEIR